jgi:hypothetical protein
MRWVAGGGLCMVSERSVSGVQGVRAELADVVLHLRDIQSAVVVAAAALRHQKCELDEDVAQVLRRSVTDRLQDQIERLEIAVQLAADVEEEVPGAPGNCAPRSAAAARQ